MSSLERSVNHPPKALALLQQCIVERVLDTNYRLYPEQYDTGWLFDFRVILLEPAWLNRVTDLLYEYIKSYESVQIGGLESAALPLVTSLTLKAAQEGKSVNGFYIRKSRKKSGTYKLVEGNLTDRPIVLVDDLMNTSSSVTRQIIQLEEYGKEVAQVLTIVRFRPREEYTLLQEKHISIDALFTLDDFNVSLPDSTTSPDIVRPRVQWRHQVIKHSPNIVLPRSRPVVVDDVVLFGCDDGYLNACDVATGAVRWRHQVGRGVEGKRILSSPTVCDGLVYFGAYDGAVYALHVTDGTVAWSFREADAVGSSPCVDPATGTVYIGLEYVAPQQNGSTIALDSKTGARKWEYLMRAFTHASPIYVANRNRVYIGGNEGVLYALDADTGALVWKFETKGGARYSGTGKYSPGDIKLMPVYDTDTDTVVCSSFDGYVYVLDAENGQQRYALETDVGGPTVKAGVYGEPLVTKTHIFVGALDKHVHCFDKRTGALVWSTPTTARVFSSPRVLDDKVLVGSNDGFLYVLDSATGSTIKKYTFPERIVCPVTVYHAAKTTYLLVTTNSTSVYCMVYS